MSRELAWRAAFVAAGAIGTYAPTLALLSHRPPALLRDNFRDRVVVMSGSAAVAVAAVAAKLTGVAYLPHKEILAVALAALAGAVIGVLDDLYGDPETKGLRGHLGPLRHGRVTPGAAKLAGLVVLGAAVAVVVSDGPLWRAVVDTVLVAGTANLVNLLDLRPGRAVKGVLLLGAPIAVLGAPVCAVPFGMAAGLLPADVRERAMLGDGGANGVGAALGAALVISAPHPVAVVVAAFVVLLTAASERASFTSVIERTALLRWADRLGRPA